MAYVAASAVSGMNLEVRDQGAMPNSDCVRLFIYGTYTAADFYLAAGEGVAFAPGKVRIVNLTDGTVGEWYLGDTTNLTNSGFTQVIGGTKTLVAKASAGVFWNAGRLEIKVTACCPITDNDKCMIEIYRG